MERASKRFVKPVEAECDVCDGVKVLVVGCGFVAQHLMKAFLGADRYEVSFTHRGSEAPFLLPEGLKALGDVDVRDGASCARALWMSLPDVVVNAAAVSSPKNCESDPEEAMATNCPMGLLEAMFAVVPDALFIQFSTDIVNGDRGLSSPLYADGGDRLERIQRVLEDTKPENVYGKSKLAFEKRLFDSWPRCVLFRCSNVIGPKAPFSYDKEDNKKFGAWLFEALSTEQEVHLWYDEIRSFVWISQIVDGVVSAIDKFAIAHVPADSAARVEALAAATKKPTETAFYDKDARRTYPPVFLHLNAGGPEALSRVHVGRAIAETITDHHASINAIPRSTLPYPSPLDVAMDSSNFQNILQVPLLSIRDALQQQNPFSAAPAPRLFAAEEEQKD